MASSAHGRGFRPFRPSSPPPAAEDPSAYGALQQLIDLCSVEWESARRKETEESQPSASYLATSKALHVAPASNRNLDAVVKQEKINGASDPSRSRRKEEQKRYRQRVKERQAAMAAEVEKHIDAVNVMRAEQGLLLRLNRAYEQIQAYQEEVCLFIQTSKHSATAAAGNDVQNDECASATGFNLLKIGKGSENGHDQGATPSSKQLLLGLAVDSPGWAQLQESIASLQSQSGGCSQLWERVSMSRLQAQRARQRLAKLIHDQHHLSFTFMDALEGGIEERASQIQIARAGVELLDTLSTLWYSTGQELKIIEDFARGLNKENLSDVKASDVPGEVPKQQ